MTDEAPSSEPVAEMRRIWEKATPDTISRDVRRAVSIAEGLPPEARKEAQVYLEAILRLERWLHDL